MRGLGDKASDYEKVKPVKLTVALAYSSRRSPWLSMSES